MKHIRFLSNRNKSYIALSLIVCFALINYSHSQESEDSRVNDREAVIACLERYKRQKLLVVELHYKLLYLLLMEQI